MSQTNINRIAFLDYLRIFAFASVLIGHKFYGYLLALANDVSALKIYKNIAVVLMPLFKGGGVGVVVFFLVSGYIIAHVLQKENCSDFVIRRIFRIYPLYIIAVATQSILASTASGNYPDLSVLVPQLLLIGDFFGTPYTLNGVEWTLRVEIMFYAFMAALRWMGLISEYRKFLPYVLVAATFMLGFAAPVPSAEIWSKGYFSIFGPFLFLGTMIYLAEKKQVTYFFLILFGILIFYQHYNLMVLFQKRWIDSHFAALAFLIFITSWIFRKQLKATFWVLVFSDLTYAVYLFHNWIFEVIKYLIAKLSIPLVNIDIQTTVVLLLFSFLMVKFIEKPGIRLGRIVLTKLRSYQNNG